jgi:hypothetical protein
MTSINLNTPKHVISLASSGFLMSVETHIYTGVRSNKEATEMVTTNMKAAKNAAKVSQYLFGHAPEHKAIVDYRQRIYNWSQREGFDWAGQQRYVPALIREKVLNEYQAHDREFYRLVAEFGAAYQARITEAAFTQGDMFNANDYAPWAQIEKKFSCDLIVTEVPVGDFRESLFQESAAEMHKYYEKQISRVLDGLMEEASTRVMDMAVRLQKACEEKDPLNEDGKKTRRRISDVLLPQARDMVKTLRAINVTGNQELADALDSIDRATANVTLDALKDSAVTRHEVKTEIDSMLSKFAPLKTLL